MAQNQRFALAVHSAGIIGCCESCAVTSETIARSIGTNPVVIRRVFGMLVRAGIVEVRKGQNGGARLSRSAAEISLGDIYRAVDPGPALPVPELRASCAIGAALQHVFEHAESRMIEQLDQTPLSKVIAQVQQRRPV